MRGLFLATAAMLTLGIRLNGTAYAQATTSSPPAPPSPPPGATYGVAAPAQPPNAALYTNTPGMAPGSFAVHLNGRLNYYVAVTGSTADQFDGNKLGNTEFQGYIRLYPGFDAVAANGLQYGVIAEIRNPGSNDTGTGISASGNSTQNTLYWNEAYGYLGLPNLGTVNFGQTDAAFDLLQVGTFENFNDGAWNGDVPGFVPANDVPYYPFADVSAIWGADRVTYMSPIWSGFQFGASFAPDTASLWNTENCTVASGSCNRVISTDDPAQAGRWRNMLDVAGQYNNTFGPIGVSAYAGYISTGQVTDTSPLATPSVNMSVGAFGLTLSWGPVTVGGHMNFGNENYLWSLQPKGGVPGLAFMVGAEYATGPIIVGASYFKYKFQGDFSDPSTEGVETDQGIAAGGTLTIAPGMLLYLSYLYGQRHQAGYDMLAGSANSLLGEPFGTNNNVQAQLIGIGTEIKW